jgi:hypothetical protein
MGIKRLKRNEIICYKPSDLWTQEDDLVFLKWVRNKRDRCYHIMTRDLPARPHEKDLQSVKERMASIENVLVVIQPLLQNLKPEMLSKLQLVGINK